VTELHGSSNLAVVRLLLSDFRSYPQLRMDVAPRPVVLLGPNGAGKTNILEALSFLSPGRGLRRARLADVARQGSSSAPWAVSATIASQEGAIELGTGRDGDSERRLVRIDGSKARSQASLGEWVSILWLVPSMERLFTDSAGGRRRFLDRLVLGLEPAHASRAVAFEHSLRERNRLLKEGRRDRKWLEAVELALVDQGLAITNARHSALARLNEACGQGIGPFPAADLRLDGKIDETLAKSGMAQTRQWLIEALAASRGLDETLVGPHRSDFLVRHREKDLAALYCSTGEQKALLLSILLGQARLQAGQKGRAPILLLDEVAAHLDVTRRTALWDELDGLGLQSWMTGTDLSLFAELGERGQFFDVTQGSVAPLLQ
jgi:DNA replication and repair protein RecF